MKPTERPLAAAALLLVAILLPACAWTEECSGTVPTIVTLRADQMCPSAREVQARVDSEVPRTGGIVDSEARTQVAIQARVVCWYRSTEAEGITPCLWGTRASMLIDATRPEQAPDEGLATSSTSYLLSCDAEGTLYGQIILVADANASTGLPAAPVDCPEEATPAPSAAEKLTAVTTFVGSDEYPARVTCEYDTTVHFPCGLKELRY
ncbi:hypothetical protein [Sorangium sp. So ce1000]|uniref:hypothetical protein n=1 Tax=Sorangium sp. So ce1000 TaxID=3133325 RepID=UPI003F5F8CD9